jgi:predicted N-acetyltransferase YhbS
MTKATLELRPPDPRTDREAIFDLIAKVFGKTSYYEWIDHLQSGYFDASHYDGEASTVGLIDGQIVTHWGVWDYRMRVGSETVRVAGVGAVATDGFHQGQGLMRRTIEAGLERMRQAGYDLSVLYGISDFYHKYGYAQAWPKVVYIVSADQLPDDKPAGRLRRGPVVQDRELDVMYNRTFAGRTGSAVRPTYGRFDKLGSVVPETIRWLDDDGRAVGYVRVGVWEGRLQCTEACGEVEQILRVLGRQARRGRHPNVELPDLHWDHPLAMTLRRRGVKLTLDYQASGGAMVRVLNLDSTLENLAGELQRRLAGSPLADWSGTLDLHGTDDRAALRIGRGRVRVGPAGRSRHALRARDALGRLLIGSADPEEILRTEGVRCAGDGRRLARVLFPEQHPMLSMLDHF